MKLYTVVASDYSDREPVLAEANVVRTTPLYLYVDNNAIFGYSKRIAKDAVDLPAGTARASVASNAKGAWAIFLARQSSKLEKAREMAERAERNVAAARKALEGM